MEDAQICAAEVSIFASRIDTGGYYGIVELSFFLSFSPYKTGIRGEISNLLELLLAAKAKNFDANHQTLKLIKTRDDPS